MRTETEIVAEIKDLEERIRGMQYDDPMWDKLNSRIWALRWVLKTEG